MKIANEPTMTGHGNLSLMLLANDILFKALEMHCSDLHLEPEDDQSVTVRYLVKGESKKDEQLPHGVLDELALCYKALAGLNIKEHSRPQDKHATLEFNGRPVGIRVTAIPGDCGETVALTFKYAD